MNWIIKSTKNLGRHTDLATLLADDWVNIFDYNWFLSNLDIINFGDYNGIVLPIDFRDDYQLPSIETFKKLVDADIQIIWGVISAVKDENPRFDPDDLPYVEGNDGIWEDDYIQVSNAIFEITAWDSSYTIIKFRDEDLSKKFQEHFPEAILLSEYKF